jgi:pyrimidine operon attenuation protein/uracil phosphoribosyltransferase
VPRKGTAQKIMEDIKEVQLLLNAEQTKQKIRRMAFQIYEDNFKEKKLVIAGINGEGFYLAQAIVENLMEISDKEIFLAKIILDKSADSQPDITIECEIDTFRKKTVILVDDVLNTGKTVAFSLRPFMSIPLKKLQVAVLVDRDYLLFPIKADYVGYDLSTTLNDHVKVILSDMKKYGVYLY